MAVDYRRPALLCQTSVVDKLLSMLIVSLLLLASTPRVHSQNVRLAGNGSSSNEGRLEVDYAGYSGTVCDDYFDYLDAGVVCNSLGRGYGYNGRVIVNRFGPGTRYILLDDVHCIGNETSIADCTHGGWGTHNCGHNEDVAVSCGVSPVQHGPMPNADNFFFVADRYLRNIYQVDATSGATAQLLPFGAASNPLALAYDSAAKLLYWTDVNAHTINRYSLLTNSTTVFYRDPSNIASFYGLAIDTLRQKLYYAGAEGTFGKVSELSTDGTGRRLLISVNNTTPRAVVFDKDNRILYWTDFSSVRPGIYRSSVVNPARQTLVSVNVTLPYALTIDFAAGVMYWGDLDKIEMANLDGTGRRLLWRERIAVYFAFTFHAGNIYFTDWRRIYIRILNISALTVGWQFSDTPFHRLNDIVFVPTTSTTSTPMTTTVAPTTAKSLLTSSESVPIPPDDLHSSTLEPVNKKTTTTPATTIATSESVTTLQPRNKKTTTSPATTIEMIFLIVAYAVGGIVIITIIIAVVITVCIRTRRKRRGESAVRSAPSQQKRPTVAVVSPAYGANYYEDLTP